MRHRGTFGEHRNIQSALLTVRCLLACFIIFEMRSRRSASLSGWMTSLAQPVAVSAVCAGPGDAETINLMAAL